MRTEEGKVTDLIKQTTLYLYRGACKIINIDFTNFIFATGSKCLLTITDINRTKILKTFEFNESKPYVITFDNNFTSSLKDNMYLYNILYDTGDCSFPQCADSDIYVSEVIINDTVN